MTETRSTAGSGPSERVRLAGLAADAARTVPGVVGLDSGPGGLHATVGAGTRVTGVTSTSAPGGGYDVSLRLVCALVFLPALADAVRDAVHTVAAEAGIGVETIGVDIVDVVSDPDGAGG